MLLSNGCLIVFILGVNRMKVLWITNVMMPPICEALNLNIPVVGGWMYSSAKRLLQKSNIELSVACTNRFSREFIDKTIEGVRYFVLPLHCRSVDKPHAFLREYWKRVNEAVKPDIVHLHGTEFAHGLDYIEANGGNKVVVSIQGLVSVYYYYYYYGGIRERVVKRYFTMADLLRRNTMVDGAKGFARRGNVEREILQKANYIIGRTEWDKAHSWEINPKARYYFCSETLRDEFYKHTWNYNECEKHSIFVSQAGYPLKGLHQILEALPLVLKYYPDTKVYIAGKDITNRKPWYKYVGYGKYIRHLIRKYNLKGHIFFTGLLDEQAMCERYLKSNLFICPSAIENSPNSLGEAQLLAMPYLASYVGGSMDLVGSNTASLYRFEETVMLAKKICEVFAKEKFESNRDEVCWRYDSQKNVRDLLVIYEDVLSQKG